MVVAGLVVACLSFGWWLLVLKWEWYCFAWHSWADWSLHDADECRAVQPPYLERDRLLTSSFGFRAVWAGRMELAQEEEKGQGDGRWWRPVVVKELKDPGSCGDVKAHFREVAIERKLRHPTIVPYIASCSIGPKYPPFSVLTRCC